MAQDVGDALVDLGGGLVGQGGVDGPLVQAQFPAVAGDPQHVVLMGVHSAGVDLLGPLGQFFDKGLLVLRGLADDGAVLGLGYGEIQLVRGLDVGHLAENIHQLGQVEEPGKAGAGPVAGALGSQLQGGDGLAEPAGPAVEGAHAHLLETVVLQIPLNSVALGDGIADRHAYTHTLVINKRAIDVT